MAAILAALCLEAIDMIPQNQTPAKCKHDWVTDKSVPFPAFRCTRCGEQKQFPDVKVKKAR